ncbi:MAG: DUF1116 domain-containing protein, partial [Candidatus Ranarchaeia archaeon]
MNLMEEPLKIVNIGLKTFADVLKQQKVETFHVDWKPPPNLTCSLIKTLIQLYSSLTHQANQQAIGRILTSEPVLTNVRPARKAIPGMKQDTFLHAGPPIEWDRMCGALRGALTAAILYEGLADTPKKAEYLVRSNEIVLMPCHDLNAVSGMAGVISANRPVFEVKDQTHKNKAYCVIREGTGKALRFGVYNKEVIRKLRFVSEIIGPSIQIALKTIKRLELGPLIARALHMGDECHSRNYATTILLSKAIVNALLDSEVDKETIKQVANFFAADEQFALTVVMPACKVAMDAAHGIPYSTIVTAMTRNGTDFAIRVSGLDNQWFIAPSPVIDGLYFPGYSIRDASPDMGDSSIMETFGLGAMAMAAAPTAGQLKINGN